jgi:hypothetical protein
MAPPPPEVCHPVLARAILAPSSHDLMFGTICLHQVLQVPLPHWVIVLRTNLETPDEGLLNCWAQFLQNFYIKPLHIMTIGI